VVVIMTAPWKRPLPGPGYEAGDEPRNLPAIPGAREPEEIVLEGEIVDEEQAARTVPGQVAAVVRTVARHEHSRAIARNAAYVGIGAAVVVKRLWDSRSTARYERWIRSAEKAGDHEAALEWEDRLARFRKDRHQRRTDMIDVPARLLLQLPKLALGVLIVLAAIGCLLGIATGHVAEVAVPFRTVAKATEIAVIVVSVAWGPLVLSAPWFALAGLWWTGRGHAQGMTGWVLARKTGDDGALVVTADTIVLALQNLRIPELKKAAKDGWRPSFHTMPIRDGRGYSAVFSLPLGVTAGMIADQRPVLARNVHRAEVEVWPSDAEKAGLGPAGTAAVWIADPGVLSKAAPEYPLLHEGTADVFAGVPGGVSPRGDVITIPVVGTNFVCGGQMGQGKSNACRVVMLGAALDPLAELDVFVFANNGDFDAYAPRLAVYVKGVEDDAIAAAVARLHELYAEVARREERLADLGAKKLTRQLAQQYRDLRPIVALFSECHELFGHPEHGAVAAELATKTAKRARKTGITLGFDTQSSRKEAIPPKLVELVSVNVCFYCKTWRSNDGFLGDGSFAAGIRATELRPGRDRGTSIITGVSEGQFELLRWYFIEVDDDTGYDAAAEVIARAVGKVAPGTPVEGSAQRPAIEARDLLDDLGQVVGGERVKLRDAVALLRDLAPAWGAYRQLTAAQLRKDLIAEDVRVVNSSGTPYVDPADLRRAIADRSTEDLDEE
jgi:DNA segregation ATPase FtsK/SpoIIIE, S-DNA-T family